MKRTLLVKAVAGAGALFIIGTGVAYAAGSDSAENKLTTTVTVTAEESLTLQSDKDASTFSVAGTVVRNGAPVLLTATAGDVFDLAYTTDNNSRKISVAAASTGDTLLAADMLTLAVNPGAVTTNTSGPAVTPQMATLGGGTTSGVLVPTINGATERNQKIVSPLTVTASAGTKAPISTTNEIVLLFTIGA